MIAANDNEGNSFSICKYFFIYFQRNNYMRTKLQGDKCMAIKYPPEAGQLLLCRFDGEPPEMTKKRPVVVLSTVSPRLCIVVPLSTKEPEIQEKWHYLVNTPNPLPHPYNSKAHWLKGDMVCAVSYERLYVPCKGKSESGRRIYVKIKVTAEQLSKIKKCVAAATGISPLDINS